MTTVVVAGAVANKPLNGGEAWTRLTLVRGLLALGVDAHLVEQIGDDDAGGAAFFARVVRHHGLAERATLIRVPSLETDGRPFGELLALADEAALLVNVSGHLQLPVLRRRFHRSAYLDLDPGFTQYWEAAGISGAHLEGHDYYFTVGVNIGSPSCSIPTCGIQWRATWPVVLLEDWPVTGASDKEFTTISSWRGPFGRIKADGRLFGLKAHEFRRFVSLPQLTGHRFELALAIDPSEVRDLALLRDHGWRLVEPSAVAGDPVAYREYVQASRAEFSVAQGVYVETASGWFSDRTVRYLASGKPTLLQDTGFGRLLPTGQGIVPFTTLDQARDGARSIARDYDLHAAAARSLAERFFSADVVLARMLEEADVR